MASEFRFFAPHRIEPPFASTRSPTAVFAVDEPRGVLRLPGIGVERRPIAVDRQVGWAGGGTGRRWRLAPRALLYVADEGERSTCSTDADEEDPGAARDRPPCDAAAFRPASLAKRSWDRRERRRRERAHAPAKRRACGIPSLRRANPVGSDEEREPAASWRAVAPPGAHGGRVSGPASSVSGVPSPFASLFDERAAPPAVDRRHLQGDTCLSMTLHPLPQPFQQPFPDLNAWSRSLEATLSFTREECKTGN